jgi:hypothetical protein
MIDGGLEPRYLAFLVEMLPQREYFVRFDPGLTDREVARIEDVHGFRFPSDLRSLLQYALPLQDPLPGGAIPEGLSAPIGGFPDWRHESDQIMRWRLDGPLEGILFDIEHNDFWLPAWGEKPAELEPRLDVGRRNVAQAPTLIPVYHHRCIPDDPLIAGNPVFSVHQTDIIYYGADLATYFLVEFGIARRHAPDAPRIPRYIPFWAEITDPPYSSFLDTDRA